MNINTSNTFSVSSGLNASNKNSITGLASGIDTDSIVEQMLSGLKSKIEKQEASHQQNTWKQEQYREIIASVNKLSSTYLNSKFDADAKNNMASANFFNSMKSSVTSGSGIRIISTDYSASAGDIDVIVKKLGETANISSDAAASAGLGSDTIKGGEIDLEAVTKAMKKEVGFVIGGTTVTVSLNQITSRDEMVSKINSAIQGNTATADKAKAEIYDGKLRIVTENAGTTVSIDASTSTTAGLAMTGFTASSKSQEVKGNDDIVIGNKLTGGNGIDMNAGMSFSITYDGVTKNIMLDPAMDANGKVTADTLLAEVQSKLNKALGGGIVTAAMDTSGTNPAMSFKLNNRADGHSIRISGMDIKTIGMKSGASTDFNTDQTLGELGVGAVSFSINGGKTLSFSGDTKMSKVLSEINASGSGVKISYESFGNRFKMEATSSGAAFGINVEQSQGDLFGKIFGTGNFSASPVASGSTMHTKSITGNVLDPAHEMTSAYLTMTVDNVLKTFTLPTKSDPTQLYTMDEVMTKFDEWLVAEFPATPDPDNAISFDRATGKLMTGNHTVSFAKTGIDQTDSAKVEAEKKLDLGLVLGLNTDNKNNSATKDSTVADLGLEDIFGANNASMTMEEMIAQDITTDFENTDVPPGTGRFTFSFNNGSLILQHRSGETGEFKFDPASTDPGIKKLSELFGSSITVGDGAMVGGAKMGADVELIINGVDTTRSSNTFTINGVTMEATAVSKEKTPGAGDYEKAVLTSKIDTDTIVTGVKAFIDEYNKTMKLLSDYTGQERNYRKFTPLTAAQEKEMSTSEVEAWNKKTKEGLLYNDSTVNGYLQAMRETIYSKTSSSDFTLYQIGIETGEDWKEGGQLHLDEAALRKAIETDAEAVKNLFTDKSDGVAKKLSDITEDYAKESYGTPGLLVSIAGTKTAKTSENDMTIKLVDIKSKIKDLKAKYDSAKERYWKQFTAMEKSLQNSNSQSNWLSSSFG